MIAVFLAFVNKKLLFFHINLLLIYDDIPNSKYQKYNKLLHNTLLDGKYEKAKFNKEIVISFF